jgi:putative PIN family toxin of toxin-antitoxin system
VDVVLDTNVIVSALISSRGAPSRIYQAWSEGRFSNVTSPPLLEELLRTLSYPRVQRYLGWPDEARRAAVQVVAQAARIVHPKVSLHVVDRDPADNRVLEAAVAGNVSHVVTGDQHLLDLGSYEAIEIVTAARFAAQLSLRP